MNIDKEESLIELMKETVERTTRIESRLTNFLDVNGVSTTKEGSVSDKKQQIFVEYNDDGHTTITLQHDDVRCSVLKKFLSNRIGKFELKFKSGETWKIIK